jgi:hypothetical protein
MARYSRIRGNRGSRISRLPQRQVADRITGVRPSRRPRPVSRPRPTRPQVSPIVSRPQTSPVSNTPTVTYQNTQQQIQQQAQQLANAIIAEQQAAAETARLGRIYMPFDAIDDVLPLQIETVTKGLFSGNTGSLVNMFTSSNLTATQKTYYQEVFSVADPGNSPSGTSELSIAYGHFAGSGSRDLTGNLNNDTPTRAIYKQYAQILLAPNDKKFTFNGTDSDSIYILNFNRARMREKIDPGNFELTMGILSGSAGVKNSNGLGFSNAGHTGSAVRLNGLAQWVKVIDDSSTNSADIGESGQVYNLISGSIDGGTSIFNAASPVYYGLLYPQHGIAILNGDTLDANVGFETVSGSLVQGDNAVKLFKSLSGSNMIVPNTQTGGIQARSSEQVKSTYYFVRIKNGEFNYSNNPTFTTGSLGEMAFNSFIQDPQIYVTTVGLFNVKRELLAVAKLSQPLLKNFTREALIKVKLDF